MRSSLCYSSKIICFQSSISRDKSLSLYIIGSQEKQPSETQQLSAWASAPPRDSGSEGAEEGWSESAAWSGLSIILEGAEEPSRDREAERAGQGPGRGRQGQGGEQGHTGRDTRDMPVPAPCPRRRYRPTGEEGEPGGRVATPSGSTNESNIGDKRYPLI